VTPLVESDPIGSLPHWFTLVHYTARSLEQKDRHSPPRISNIPMQVQYTTTPYKPLVTPNLPPGLKAQFVTKKALSLRIFCPLFLPRSLIQ